MNILVRSVPAGVSLSMAEVRFCRHCNFAYFALWVYNYFAMCKLIGYLNLCVGTDYTSIDCNSYLLSFCSLYVANILGTHTVRMSLWFGCPGH